MKHPKEEEAEKHEIGRRSPDRFAGEGCAQQHKANTLTTDDLAR